MLPVITKLPFQMLYPTGAKQERTTPKYPHLFRWADVVAGDFHFIRRYMPDDLAGKTVFTQTITPEDRAALERRGAAVLITAAPDIEGRSFATNVLEGIVVALSGRRSEALSSDEFVQWMLRAGFRPRVERLAAA
jgi:hypothetical protein